MSDMNLTQSEAHMLIAMEKHRADKQRRAFPMPGQSLIAPLQSVDGREQFFLDISRGRIDLRRGKYQNRARQVIVLVRLDFGGRHTAIRMMRKSPARIYTCIERATVISGPCPFRWISSPSSTTCGPRWRIS